MSRHLSHLRHLLCHHLSHDIPDVVVYSASSSHLRMASIGAFEVLVEIPGPSLGLRDQKRWDQVLVCVCYGATLEWVRLREHKVNSYLHHAVVSEVRSIKTIGHSKVDTAQQTP